MIKNFQKKPILRGAGIVLVGGLIILSWWIGWFSLVFYLLGLYAAVYIVSYLFKTTSIINVLLAVGGFVLYAVSAIVGLYLLYSVLQIMFTENFWYGILLFLLLGGFGGLLYFIPMAIGLILGYPLIFMSNDIEERFHNNQDKQTLKRINEATEVHEKTKH